MNWGRFRRIAVRHQVPPSEARHHRELQPTNGVEFPAGGLALPAALSQDQEIAKVLEKLGRLGPKWVDLFVQLYLPVNKQRYLPDVLRIVIAAAREELDPTSPPREGPIATIAAVRQSANHDADRPFFIGNVERQSEVSTRIDPPRNAQLANECVESAAELDLFKMQMEQFVASLGYFVKLGSGEEVRDFRKVQQMLAGGRRLISGSEPFLLKIAERAERLRFIAKELGSEQATNPNEQNLPVMLRAIPPNAADEKSKDAAKNKRGGEENIELVLADVKAALLDLRKGSPAEVESGHREHKANAVVFLPRRDERAGANIVAVPTPRSAEPAPIGSVPANPEREDPIYLEMQALLGKNRG